MTPYEIPLSPNPQVFAIELNGVTYSLNLYWNEAFQCWMLDINASDGTPIINGIPVITGTDLLSQYGYLNFGGSLIAQTDHNAPAVPTLDNLGSTGHLYFIVEP